MLRAGDIRDSDCGKRRKQRALRFIFSHAFRIFPLHTLPVLLSTFIVGPGAFAHHAPSIYDTSSEQLITGTVLTFDWVQPHTWTTVEVTGESGEPEVWALEGMNSDYLGRRGWHRNSLRPGDRIEVSFYPRRDGERRGMFIRATLPDGTVKVMAVPVRESAAQSIAKQ